MSRADFFSDYEGAENDKEMALLAANGAAEGALGDRWIAFLEAQGVASGDLHDRQRQFLLEYLELADVGQTLEDLWDAVDGPYEGGGGMYGPPLTITTSTGSGPFTLTDSASKRTSFVLEELEVGPDYRIDFDIVSFTGAAGFVDSDLADVAGGMSATAVAVGHYGYISPGRFAYDSTYRFVDIRRTGDAGSFTVENLTLRKVLT